MASDTHSRRKTARGSRLGKAVAAVVLLVALYAIVVAWVLPAVLRPRVETHLTTLAGGPARLERIRIHPFLLRAEARGFSLADPAGAPLVTFSNLVVDLEASSLWRRELAVREVSLISPSIHVARDREGQINLLALAERARANMGPSATTNATESTNLFPVTVERLVVTNALVSFRDEALPQPFEARLAPILITVGDLSTRTGRTAAVSFSARTDGDEEAKFTGALQVQPLVCEGTFAISDIPLARYRPYAEAMAPVVPTSGVADFEIPFRVELDGTNLNARVRGARFAVGDLAVIEKTNQAPLLEMSSIALEGLEVALQDKRASLERVELDTGALHVRRPAPTAPAESQPAQEGGAGGMIEPEAIERRIQELTDWQAKLGTIEMKGLTVNVLDETTSPAARLALTEIALSAQDISNAAGGPPARLELSALWGGAGKITVSASVNNSPVGADLEIGLDGIALESLDPYIAQFARLTLNRGLLSGAIKAGYGRQSDAAGLVRASGNLALKDFVATEAAVGSDFISWDAVELNDFNVALEPNRLSLAELIVRQLQTSLIVHADGQLNVLRILQRADELTEAAAREDKPEVAQTAREKAPAEQEPKEETADASPPDSPPAGPVTAWPIRVGAVRLEGVSLLAADQFYADGFRTTVESIDGEIRDVTYPPEGPAEIDLTGRLTALSGFAISGRVQPDPGNLKADLALNARDAELAQFAPYSLRFTGYPITRGRLTADVRYQVEDGQLNASNHIIIDDFTLGDRVESPDAIDIPLKLGVSLLKDREGRIRLDVPLTGSLSDPKFRVGPILWQVVQNIIVKAVTAPFTMLGSLFGSKEELEFVEFEPGSAEISASQTNRLAVLSKGLVERPQLQLEILPGFDPVEDRRGLAAAALDRQLRDLRLEEYARQGTATINVQLSPEDRARLIPVAYAKRFGNAPARVETPAAASPEIPSTSDPSDPAAQEQAASEGVSVEQMERRLIDTARVQPEELLDLAARRAAAVQAHLLQAIPSAEERIALAPDGAKNPGEGKSRVTFRLK